VEHHHADGRASATKWLSLDAMNYRASPDAGRAASAAGGGGGWRMRRDEDDDEDGWRLILPHSAAS